MNMMNKIYRILFTVIAVWVVTFCYAGTVVLKTTTNGTVTAKVNDANIAGPSDSSSDKTSEDKAGGTTVTLEISPDDGYYLYQLVITPYASATSASAPRRAPTVLNNITPTKIDDNTYTFIMPANMEKVEVSATFALQGDLSSAVVTLQSNNHTFDFLYHTPVVSKVTLNSVTLTEGTDYTVSGNDPVKDVKRNATTEDVEEYTITVTGKGKYYGTKEVTYTVNPRTIADASITLFGTGLSGTSFIYLKNTIQKAEVSGVYVNGQSLVSGTDYQEARYYVGDNLTGDGSTYAEFDSQNAGTYTIVIKGKGNFDGTTVAKKTYTINKKDISTCTVTTTPSNAKFTYDGSAKTLVVKVTDSNGIDLTSGTGNDYTVSGNVQTAVGGYTATVSANNINYTGSVNVPFTINVSNDGYYISYSSTSVSTTHSETYTGSQIELTPGTNIFVKKRVNAVPADNDPVLGTAYYRLVYNNNTDVGTATVTAIGKGGYDFMANANFEITAKSIENSTITLSDFTTKKNNSTTNNCFMYNGSNQKPTVTVMDGTKQLLSGTDYILTNNGGVNAGDYTVTITGTGNYTGTKTSASYSIEKKPLAGADITLSTTTLVYDGGNVKKPEVTLVKTTDGVVAYASDYDVTWTNYTNAGSSNSTDKPTVTVTAKSSGSNFTGSCLVYYTIEPKTITSDMVTLSSTASNWKNNSFTYTGSLQTPSVTVQYQYLPDATPTTSTTKTLTFGTDYNLTNDGGTEVGVYYATVVGTGNYKGTINAPYSIVSDNDEEDVNVTLSGDFIYTGSAIIPTIVVTKGTGDNLTTLVGKEPNSTDYDYDVTITNNINVGTATVTVVGRGNYHFVKTKYFDITARPLTAAMVSLSANNFTFNGSAQKPTITVTYNGVRTEGLDYTLVNEGTTDVGTGYYEVTGIGNFSGTLKSSDEGMSGKRYTISALDLSSTQVSSVDIVLYPLANAVYDGTDKEPGVQKVVITLTNNTQLTLTSGYTVSYTNNKNASTTAPTVTIGGTNFTGTASTTFTILPKPLTDGMVSFSTSSFTYNSESQKPTVTVTDLALPGSDKNIGSSNYSITWPENTTDPGEKEVQIVAQNNYSGTITKTYTILPAGGDYYVTIGGTYTYDGTAKTPHDADANHTNNITVTKGTGDGATTLTLNTDYTVSYRNNINAGNNSAIAIVTGKGKYSFTVEKAFTILQRTMNQDDIVITLSDNSFTYNGNEQKPSVSSVKDGYIPLHVGIDYEITYPTSEYIGQGTKTININGIGNYKDTKAATYTINKLSLETAVITLPATRFEYSRGAQTPTPVVSVGNFVVPSANYDVRYDNDNNTSTTADVTNIGQKTVYVTGKNNCDGSKTTTYEIVAKQIDANMVTLTHEVMTYTGSALDPGVVVKDGEATLVVGTNTEPHEYKVELTNNTKVGTATVTVEGQGNYTGKVQKTFTIQEKVHSDFTIADIAAVTYDGTAHEPTPNVKYSGTNLTLNTDYTLSYTNNVNAGTATVTVTGKGGYEGSTGTKTFTINPKELISDMVTLSNFTVTDQTPKGFTYNGNNQKPNVTITDVAGIIADDYDITNAGGVDANDTNNPTYSVTITGKRNYTGTVNLTYKIYPMSITAAEVTLSYNNIVYNGVVQKPGVQTVYANGHQLTATTDYTISWPDGDYTNQGVKSVTVTGTGNYKDSKSVTYTIAQKDVTSSMIKIANENLTYTGNPQAAAVTIEDKVGDNNIITTNDYTLTNPEHTDVGNYEVQIVGKGNYKGTATKQYSIITAGTSGFTVEAISAQDYIGLPLKPTVVVKKAGTETVLTEYTDYTLTWTNNINAGENTASVTVTGKGNYSGTQTVYFTIVPKSLNAAGITVTLSPESFNYTGTTQKPTVTVKDETSKTLAENTDYMLVNDGGVANGTYTVTITGMGNYKDVVTPAPSYTIGGQSLNGAEVILNRLDSYVYDGNEKKPGVSEVKVGSTVIPASNYTVSYADNVNAGTATVTVTGKGNCSGTATATFTITPKTVNSDMITISPTTFNYDGVLHKPTTVTVKDGTRDMVEDTDYTLSNPGGTDIGSYGVTITGKGNYTGTASKSFSIVANDASGFSINAIADVTYNGAAQEPVPVVKEGDNTLSSNYYSVAYLNNINAGTAVVTVTGKNGYSFVKSQTFKIKPKALNNDMLTLSASSFMYNGNVQKPTPTMDDKNAGVSIITSNDYVVTNEGGVDVGTYHVVITGQNNYTGAIDKTFTITQLSLSTATITLATLSSYVYDGLAKTPAVQLVKVGELVVPATAYDVAYTSNTNVGTATVTVTAKTGTNFKDGNTTTFSIEQKPVTSDMIYLSSENLEYTGSNIKPEVTVKDGTKTLALTTDYTLTNAGGTEVGSYEVMITGQGNYKGTAKKQYSIITKGAAGFTVDEMTVPLTYTGMPLTPTVTVKKAGTTTVLTLGTDYEVAYTDNINVGTATATVTGKGNYSGTRSVNFIINPKPLTDGMVALSSTSFTYNGSEQKPVVSVTDTDNNLPLTQNTDYTVTYPADAISQGTKTVTIRGIGNYTGEIKKDYTIGLLSLNDASVTLNELTSYIYDGTEKKPTVREVLVGTLVIPTTGYTVAYPDDVINIGTKTMTITGKGNYTGATTASYTITPKTVNKEMILLSSENLIYTGSIIKPTVTVKDGSKTLIENTDYTLTNEGGKEVGTYSLTITGKGNYTGTASRTFNIITKGASVFSVSDIASVIYNGSEQEPDITVMDNSTSPATVLTEGTHYTVAYSNNKNVGSASVIVTGIGSYAGTVSKNFTILPKTLTGAMVTLSATSFVFNSLAQKPEVTVDDKNAANVSIITDYDYTILNNGGINVGDNHEVKVTGKGNYTGTVTKTYAITPLSIADANVTLYQLQSYVYDGTAKRPGVREVMVGDITVPTTGYDVSYGENTNVGTATVTLTGKGNFKDAKTVNFTITGKPISSDMIVLSSENFIYNGEVQKPTVVVKDGAKTLTLGTDYALTNAGGTSVGTYSVTVAGMGNYASEASRSYSIVEKDGTTNFTISLSNTSVQYNGSAQTPTVTVTDGVKTLTYNTDYEVAYTNHVNVGTATVTVMGKGNYAGTKMATFTITAKPLTEAMVTLSETSFVYNTLIQKPEVSVSDGDIMTKDDYVITNNGGTNQGTYHVIVNGQGNYSGQIDKTFTITPLSIADANVTLYQLQSYVYEGLQKKPGVREVTVGNINVPTQGYTTSYGDNVNAGTASVTVTGLGNFKDSKTVTFEIEPKAVENSMITLSNYEYTYNGEIQKPEVIVRDGETTLVLDTDYTLQNNGGKTVGAYDVTITGKGNYKGTASKTYIINAKEVGSFEVTLSAESVIYNGSEQQPEVTVKDGETVLTPSVNYTVAYTDNVNVGMATVTVRGLGEYDGSRNKTFLIKPKELSNAMVSLSNTTFTYNGLLQMPAVTVSDGTALTSNDYYITNEGGLDKGTYNVMVTGRNNYTGTVVRQYAINPMSINDAHVTLYQLQSYVYDGTEKNPGVREVAVGSHIVPSTSFTTTISPNVNVGTVTVTVTGEKNYTGSASTTFEITPKPVTSGMITLTPDYFYYNGSVQKPAVSVKDGSKNMVENTDYTVTNEGGMEAGDYEVKVKGIGNYMDEASVKFTILSSGVNTFVVTLETTEYTFDGTEHKPNVTVKMEDRTLSEGTDYTLLYNNNVNAGTATVTVKGVGDYTGEQMKTFVILPKTLTDEMVTLDKTSFIYNEKVQKPEVTVADGTLMTEDDYTVTNEGGTDEGTYQVVVVGQNNYKGTVIKSFTITREEIHGDDDPEHPDEKPITYTPTEEGSDEVKVSGCEGTETELEQVTSVTVPATFTSNGKTYTVVGISANAFANVPNLTDVYLPDTEEPLEIAEDAIPATATIHTTLALLDDYALMPSLSESFKAGKIMTTVTAKNRYWTFSSGVDVYVPGGVTVYIARERDNATVTIVELSDNDLTVGGQRIIKHNNGVLISSEGNDTPYDLVACGRRMTSGTTISTDDYKDYGSQNCLVPVIVATHFGTGYYFMKNNEFYSIQEESEDIKVPAGKAVLYLRQAASSPSYSSIIQLVNTGEVTNINSITDDTDEGDWYDMSGRKLNGRPTKRGVYIKNNKKTVIR